jgi:hypothetical protein
VFAVAGQEIPRSGFVGMGGLACLLFLDLGTARLVPWWVTTALVVLWLVLLGLGMRWFEPHPRRVPWLVVLGFCVWLGAVVGGSLALGSGSG